MTSTISTLPDYDAPQVAINDIGSEEDFLAAIDATIKYFNDGDIVEGTIVKVDRDEVLLDIGYKTEGVIPSRELSIKHDVDPNEVVSVGDKVEALVLQKEDKEGRLILSKKRAQYERAWGTIEKVKEEDGVVEGTVIEVVKGGLILDIGLRGFLPASLVEMRRVRDLQPYVGQTLEAKIIELDKNRNNVVLSRRAWLEQTQSEVRHGFLTQLQKGQIRKGVVSSIVNFGAFVDLGGVDGLVHVSELSWKHIDHPSEVVEVGDEVTVEVLDVDMDRERVSLSLKATQEDPWQHFARTHQIGQIVPGQGHQAGARSVRSSASRRASRAWCTSPSSPSVTSRSPSRSSRSTTTSWSRSSTSTSSVAASRCRSSRPTRPPPRPTSRSSTRRSTAWPPRTTSRATTSTPRASTPRPASGSRASTTSARSGRTSTPRRTPAGRRTSSSRPRPSRPRSRPARPRPTPPVASVAADDETGGADTGGSLASDEALQALREKLTGGQA